jgi:hypothetical protein
MAFIDLTGSQELQEVSRVLPVSGRSCEGRQPILSSVSLQVSPRAPARGFIDLTRDDDAVAGAAAHPHRRTASELADSGWALRSPAASRRRRRQRALPGAEVEDIVEILDSPKQQQQPEQPPPQQQQQPPAQPRPPTGVAREPVEEPRQPQNVLGKRVERDEVRISSAEEEWLRA